MLVANEFKVVKVTITLNRLLRVMPVCISVYHNKEVQIVIWYSFTKFCYSYRLLLVVLFEIA